MTAVLSHLENDTCPQDARPSAPVVRPLLPVVGRDLRSPLVDGSTLRYANLDYAASAPALQTVADHVCSGLEHYASVHRGAGYASQVSTAVYEGTRATVAAFVGARADDVVVITRNTTDALNLLASAVPADGPGAARSSSSTSSTTRTCCRGPGCRTAASRPARRSPRRSGPSRSASPSAPRRSSP